MLLKNLSPYVGGLQCRPKLLAVVFGGHDQNRISYVDRRDNNATKPLDQRIVVLIEVDRVNHRTRSVNDQIHLSQDE